MATEDFSFPSFADNFPCGIDSPPLWHLSPAVSPDTFHDAVAKQTTETDEDDEGDCFPRKPIKNLRRKIFSSVEKGAKRGKKEDDDDEKEEKMDMLWENFNELESGSCNARLGSDMVELGCVPSLKLSKSSDATLSTRRPSLVVFMKVLKKLFLLHNSHSSTKNRPW